MWWWTICVWRVGVNHLLDGDWSSLPYDEVGIQGVSEAPREEVVEVE